MKHNKKDRNHFWSIDVVYATAGLLILWPELTRLTSLRTLAKKYAVEYLTIEEAAHGLVKLGLLEKVSRHAKGIWLPVRMFRRSAHLDLDVTQHKAVPSEKEGGNS